MFSILQHYHRIPLCVFFFPEYHGHSLADGHFGVGKRKIRRAFAGSIIATLSDIEQQFHTLANTKTFTIDEVPKQSFEVEPLKEGIRKYSAFTFPAPHQVTCWERYQQGTPVTQALVVK